jgi:DNA polymerase
MPVLFRDIESRSALNLAAAGAWRYAADPTTEVLCIAYAVDEGPIEIWVPRQPIPEPFVIAARDPDWLVVAHNDQFETAIETRLLNPRFDWPLVPIERHRDTMAMALAVARPGSLEGAAVALGLPVQKDRDGHRLMMTMCRPRKPRKGEDPSGIYWIDDPEKRARLAEYCRQDVNVEREIYRRLPPLSESELALWVLDAVINKRGFCVDLESTEAARQLVLGAQAEINAEISALTGGKITTVGQVPRIVAYLQERGHDVPNLNKRTVAALLAQSNGDARRLLELRREGGAAAVHKLRALIAGTDADHRLRGTLQYHGAATGRWAGRRFQPQNLPRPQIEDPTEAIEAILAGDAERVRAIGDAS